jgi:uncharacterized paraquat-inducible protein A
MSEDLKIKKANLEHELSQLLESVKDKPDHIETIKIYEHLIAQIKEDIKTFGQSKQKCKSCGEILDPWERDICGPCKIADERYEEEED